MKTKKFEGILLTLFGAVAGYLLLRFFAMSFIVEINEASAPVAMALFGHMFLFIYLPIVWMCKKTPAGASWPRISELLALSVVWMTIVFDAALNNVLLGQLWYTVSDFLFVWLTAIPFVTTKKSKKILAIVGIVLTVIAAFF